MRDHINKFPSRLSCQTCQKKDSHLILVDFGVSAIRRSGWGWDPGFLGSPNYMAPEVFF